MSYWESDRGSSAGHFGALDSLRQWLLLLHVWAESWIQRYLCRAHSECKTLGLGARGSPNQSCVAMRDTESPSKGRAQDLDQSLGTWLHQVP